MASINTQGPPSGLGTFALGLAGLAVFAALIVAWIKWTAPRTDLVEAERGAARLKKRVELENDWTVKLHTAAWVDKEKGIVQVPIDAAIKAVATDLKAKQVAKSAVKVPPPLPMPVADPKSTEPPPPALPSSPQGADLIRFEAPAAAVAPTLPATPAPVTPPAPAPAPAPVPAVPAAAVAAPKINLAASSQPARPPLINWTESK